MQVRFGLAVVTGAGAEPGRDLAVRLARAGAAVLCVDPDVGAAAATAGLVEAARTRAWSLQADVASDEDLAVLAARARDLGGADMLVDASGAGPQAADQVARCFVDGLAHRRGRGGAAALVVLGESAPTVETGGAARLMAVHAGAAATTSELGTAVLALLTAGTDGEVTALH